MPEIRALPGQLAFIALPQAHRLINEMATYTIPHLETHYDVDTYRRARIRYLMNELSEVYFKRHLQNKEKVRAMNLEYSNYLNLFITAGTDILQRAVKDKKYKEYISELDELRVYINKAIARISDVYKKPLPLIGQDYVARYPHVHQFATLKRMKKVEW